MSRSLTILMFAFAMHLCAAQGVYNQSNIFINGVNVFVDGELKNDGLLQNQGFMAVSGDWKNEGDYRGNGTIGLYGNTPQVVTHGPQSATTIIINGWGTKYIKGELTITKDLQLTRGIVQVSSDDKLILAGGAIASGGSANSFVDGPLTVEGDGYKFFPVGKNGIYAPIEFLDATGGERYSVEVFENAPTIAVENVIVRRSLYWQRSDVTGYFGSSAIAIDYEPNFFQNPENIILLAGNSFDEPFSAITELEHSSETEKISTRTPVSSSIIMLGEISHRWTDADFYLSTALSPHASHSSNKSVKIFGDRLSTSQFRFQVFDRWGDLIYECHSLHDMQQNGWDGRTSAGHRLASGTYPYRLSGFDKLGKSFQRKGVITIVN